MTDLQRLRNFTALARAGSFVRAAEAVRLSQPALTRSIQSLEREWGVRLFDRGRAGASLTAVGRQLLARAEDLLHNADSLDRAVTRISTGLSGDVHFAVGPRFSGLLLATLYTDVIQLYPDIRLRSYQGTLESMLRQLFDNEIEFFLGSMRPVPVERVDAEEVARTRPSFLVRASHPLLAAEEVHYSDIARYPLMSGHGFHEVMDSFARDDPRQMLRVAYRSDCFDAMAAAARNTDVVLLALAGPDLEGLVSLTLSPRDVPLPLFPTSLYTVGGRTLSPAAAVVAERLRLVLQGLVDDRHTWTRT